MQQILKRNTLAAKLGTCSTKIGTLMKEEGFPRPIRIGKISGWLEDEVQAWIDARIAERDSTKPEIDGGVL